MGNGHPSIAPYEVLATADGELVVAVGTDRQFAALCDVLGVGALATDPRFATNAARVAHRDDLRAELEQALTARPADAWAAELSARGVPAGRVNDVAGAFALATSLGLAPTVAIPRPGGDGAVIVTRNPIGLSETPAQYRSPPPRLRDAHTAGDAAALWSAAAAEPPSAVTGDAAGS
jgi:crotonobetainyl-CoA:carnitine CoA-transferase CaiB-like acyl-CoA transferase